MWNGGFQQLLIIPGFSRQLPSSRRSCRQFCCPSATTRSRTRPRTATRTKLAVLSPSLSEVRRVVLAACAVTSDCRCPVCIFRSLMTSVYLSITFYQLHCLGGDNVMPVIVKLAAVQLQQEQHQPLTLVQIIIVVIIIIIIITKSAGTPQTAANTMCCHLVNSIHPSIFICPIVNNLKCK